MVIPFWSNLHGQGTSSNMAAIALAIALEYGRKCLVTQTHFNLNNLETYLTGSSDYNKEVFLDIGIDGLARSIKYQPLVKETIDNYSIQLIRNKLTLLPGTTSENREVFNDDVGKMIASLLREVSKYQDLVFVDLNSGNDEVSRLILEQAEFVVVNLCQNKFVIENYFTSKHCKEIFKDKKILYLIGSYDKNSSYNISNLKSSYSHFSKSKTAVIPYNTEFMDAQSNGNVLGYMRKNISLKKEGENAYFISCVKDASEKLIKLVAEMKGGENIGG